MKALSFFTIGLTWVVSVACLISACTFSQGLSRVTIINNMSSSNFFIMVSCCALSVGSVLLTSSCGGGGGGDGDDGTQVAPVELEGLVLKSGGVEWTFKEGGQMDYTRKLAMPSLIDGFSVAWPDNLRGATYTYEVTGSRSGIVTIVVADGADWSSYQSRGGGKIALPGGQAYVGLRWNEPIEINGVKRNGFYSHIHPLELQMSLNFDSQSGTQIQSVETHMRFFAVDAKENVAVDGLLSDVRLLKIDGNLPESGYDPAEDLPGPQPSTKTDGLFDGDRIELYGDVEARLNFTQDGFVYGSDRDAPVTEIGILQALWDVPSQAKYSLVQIYGTDNVILTITEDTKEKNGVITLRFEGNGDVGSYDTSNGESGTFVFIER